MGRMKDLAMDVADLYLIERYGTTIVSDDKWEEAWAVATSGSAESARLQAKVMACRSNKMLAGMA